MESRNQEVKSRRELSREVGKSEAAASPEGGRESVPLAHGLDRSPAEVRSSPLAICFTLLL